MSFLSLSFFTKRRSLTLMFARALNAFTSQNLTDDFICAFRSCHFGGTMLIDHNLRNDALLWQKTVRCIRDRCHGEISRNHDLDSKFHPMHRYIYRVNIFKPIFVQNQSRTNFPTKSTTDSSNCIRLPYPITFYKRYMCEH